MACTVALKRVRQGEALAELGFLPGQYATIEVPDTGLQRAYSFSSGVRMGQVSFLIRNVPGGLMSGFLKDRARPGDAITLSGPFGSFYLRHIQRPVLMLAGGTGLAPFLAMLDKIVASGGSPQPIHLRKICSQRLIALRGSAGSASGFRKAVR